MARARRFVYGEFGLLGGRGMRWDSLGLDAHAGCRRCGSRLLPAGRGHGILDEVRRAAFGGTALYPDPMVPRKRMPEPPSSNTPTDLLLQASAGDAAALANVFPLIYQELHRLARRQLRHEPDGQTLNPTALVHEAFIRLVDQTRVQWHGRAHFLAIAATAMRRILIDRARSRRRLKRGGELARVPLEFVELGAEDRAELLLALDDALTRLEELDERQARVVEYRFFGGLTEQETAEALGIGLRTAKRDWAKAKSWLYHQIYADSSG